MPSESQLKAARARLQVRAEIARNVERVKTLRQQTAMQRAKLKSMRVKKR